MYNVVNLLQNYALYLVFPAIVAPLLIIAFFFHVFPTKRAALLFIPPVVISCFFFLFDVSDSSIPIVGSLGVFFILVLAGDWFSVAFAGRGTSVKRTAERIVSLGQPLDVELTVANLSKKSIVLEVVDDSNEYACSLPARSSEDLLRETHDSNAARIGSQNASFFERRSISPNEQEILQYRLVWKRRGTFQFDFVAARFISFLGLWKKHVKYPCQSEFHVYPNLCQLSQLNALGCASRLFLLGVRQMRRVGQDADFERLRDYTLDDQYKFIDWKATARRNKLTVRDFQATRNQRVILALDAGRMTMNYSNGVTLFDSSLNAALALAYIALKQGDEVGVLIFSNEVKRFIAPRGGMTQMNTLIRSVFDVFPERRESRYDLAFEYLAEHSPKRALVVLATNVLDERNAAQVENALLNLAGAHLPLGVFLRERSLFDAVQKYDSLRSCDESAGTEYGSFEIKTKEKKRLALWLEKFGDDRPLIDEVERILWRESPIESLSREETFYRAGAAAEILNWRKRTLRLLEAKGALTLDVFPEDAVAPLVNKYLEIKGKRLL